MCEEQPTLHNLLVFQQCDCAMVTILHEGGVCAVYKDPSIGFIRRFQGDTPSTATYY